MDVRDMVLVHVATHVRSSIVTPEELAAKIKEYRRLIDKLMDECQHAFAPMTKELEKAVCLGCGRYFGNRCPNSPDGVCHYRSAFGVIPLITGEAVPIPEGHDPDMESDEFCIYCSDLEKRHFVNDDSALRIMVETVNITLPSSWWQGIRAYTISNRIRTSDSALSKRLVKAFGVRLEDEIYRHLSAKEKQK